MKSRTEVYEQCDQDRECERKRRRDSFAQRRKKQRAQNEKLERSGQVKLSEERLRTFEMQCKLRYLKSKEKLVPQQQQQHQPQQQQQQQQPYSIQWKHCYAPPPPDNLHDYCMPIPRHHDVYQPPVTGIPSHVGVKSSCRNETSRTSRVEANTSNNNNNNSLSCVALESVIQTPLNQELTR